ncbi:MAG: carbohydrate binding domain-containing protein [Bacteroidaceae bacterium]|nr:carbohydrate binding domain-containing protein [Bacteroidaceae bacterium]
MNKSTRCMACAALILLFTLAAYAQTATLNIDVNQKGIDISPTLYGLFYEEINHAGDGGLYAELLRNRSFEEVDHGIPNRRFDNGRGERFGRPANPNLLPYWSAVEGADIKPSTDNLMNAAQKRAMKLSVESATKAKPAGVRNTGYWGIPSVKGNKYTLSFWARADEKTRVSFTTGLKDGDNWLAKKTFRKAVTTEWKKYKVTFKPSSTAENADFLLLLNQPGTLYLDLVSLFPPTYKNRENGCRRDLAEKLEALRPKFLRFPGGCFVEGMSRESAYDWKRTVGPVEERPGHMNENWGYLCTDGMGFHEYLQLAEDLGAAPLYVVNVGIWHGGFQPFDDIGTYIQDALDALEYANGDASTRWGKERIRNGHAKPFGLHLIEVGNENYQANPSEQSDHYAERYAQFYKAIKEKYPEVQLIGNVESWGTDYPTWRNENPVDLLDEHYYRSPSWFAGKYHHYDSYDRNGPKIYVGEYAVTSNCGEGNLQAALGEAIYMMGMENNSDVVAMASYAPIFVNWHDRHWMPDMIRYDASRSWVSPSYYVQQLMAENVGTRIVGSTLMQTKKEKPDHFRVGLGSWNTAVEYKGLKVTTPEGETLYEQVPPFSSRWPSIDISSWIISDGTWDSDVLDPQGIIRQTAIKENCVAICPHEMQGRDYDVTVQARRTDGLEGFLLVFDYTGEKNYRWFNVAGWGNSQHAVEDISNGSKSTLRGVRGAIESNVWYTLRVEVRGENIKCFINGELIQEVTVTAPDALYANAETDASGNLIVKIVNFGEDDCPVSVNLNGTFRKGYTVTTLQGQPEDENTPDEPDRIVPRTETFSTPFASDAPFLAPGNSLSIIRLRR